MPTPNTPYLFTSERLGFRNWVPEDEPLLAQMNADSAVMKHFPRTLNSEENNALFGRLQAHYKQHGHTYFAVEERQTGVFIGFIGLAYQDYESAYTPAVDIGWRLRTNEWGKGYATEGAKRCLAFAFENLQLSHIIATCTRANQASENVMQKIGMRKLGEFQHPKLTEYPQHVDCVVYGVSNETVG
jgi:RimJ/RimL family protein N-acetyltransferase